jgi:MerR family transcriptional regulator, copper efflux regulator
VDSKAYGAVMSATYQIAEVADRSGFTPATLRYYEDIGLVTPAARTEAGYRLYDDSSLERLRFIARAKQLGCSLDEIAELSRAWDGGQCGPVQERLRVAVAAKIAASQRQIADMTLLTADLQRAAAVLTAHTPAGPCDDTCGCISDIGPATATTVPLIAKAEASSDLASDSCDEDCGCASEAVVDDPPIACTLDATQMGGRVAQWAALLDDKDDLLAGVVNRLPIDDGVRLEFGPHVDVTELVRLAAAEQDCCRFFRFAVSIDTRGIALEVRAPAEATEIVTALFVAPA